MPTKSIDFFQKIFFWSGSVLSLLAIFIGWYSEKYFLIGVPFLLVFLYFLVLDFRVIFYLLIFLIPLSIDYEFSNGLGTDLPTEPIMVGLMLVFLFSVITKKKFVERDFLTHPLITLIFMHFIWMVIAVIYSSLFIVSLKFVLAKTWYICVFVFLGGIIIKDLKNFKIFFWCIFPPLLFTVCYTLVRHSMYGFSFAKVNTMMEPFYLNHVIYAAAASLIVPFIWCASFWYKRYSIPRMFLQACLLLFVGAVFFSYTRSSWLSLIFAFLFAFVIRKKLMKWMVAGGIATILIFIGYMTWKNNYLDFAPVFKRTIMHEELGEHLKSTYEMEDISSEERVYRWVAGFRMWDANPIVGYGPGNFYNFYKPHTVSRFRTYVSANPERSTVHNYFLLTLIEQGVTGLLIFLALTILLLLKGQSIFHETIDKQERRMIMAIMLSIIIIYVNTFLSDLLEVDKIGTIFFLNIALLVNQDIRNKKIKPQERVQAEKG